MELVICLAHHVALLLFACVLAHTEHANCVNGFASYASTTLVVLYYLLLFPRAARRSARDVPPVVSKRGTAIASLSTSTCLHRWSCISLTACIASSRFLLASVLFSSAATPIRHHVLSSLAGLKRNLSSGLSSSHPTIYSVDDTCCLIEPENQTCVPSFIRQRYLIRSPVL